MKTSQRILGLIFILELGVLAIPAQSQTFSVFHGFNGSDGENPLAGLTIDSAGDLYGTTSAGGSSSSGTVFKVDSSGVESVLYNFTGGADGGTPQSSLLLAGSTLYGTTYYGGAVGAGTVFEVTTAGAEKVLFSSFTGGADGGNPVAGLVKDSAGNLYGTTFGGGTSNNGTVFKLVHPAVQGGTWTEEVLYSFGDGGDGMNPVAGVTFLAGHIYGTTSAGGTYGNGTVYELTLSKSGWTESILHNFEMQSDGGVPYAGITMHLGALYGAATDGGAGGENGGGTIFELKQSNGSWEFSVIYSLSGWGISGSFRNLTFFGNSIYATTHCDGANRAGTVFELTPSGSKWTYKSLYVFNGSTDGTYAFSNLVRDKAGNLYGTTKQGGPNGDGVVFKIKP